MPIHAHGGRREPCAIGDLGRGDPLDEAHHQRLRICVGQTDDYSLDRDAGRVGFTIYARVIFNVPKEGRFTRFAGNLSFDPSSPDTTHVDLTVFTNSVTMNNPEHDALLRSDDFFDVDHFPMHFVSEGVTRRSDGTFAVTGDLTIRDVTDASPCRSGSRRPLRPARGALFQTTFEVDRTEYGLNGTARSTGISVPISKTVQIKIAIAGIARQTPQ